MPCSFVRDLPIMQRLTRMTYWYLMAVGSFGTGQAC